MGQFQDLKAQAAIIRDEQNSYQNTSLRVGRMFIDILEQLEKVLPDENVKPETLTVEATETSYKLKFSTLTSDGSVKSHELDLPIATDTKAGVMSPALMKGIKDQISQLSLKVDSNKTDSDNKISELERVTRNILLPLNKPIFEKAEGNTVLFKENLYLINKDLFIYMPSKNIDLDNGSVTSYNRNLVLLEVDEYKSISDLEEASSKCRYVILNGSLNNIDNSKYYILLFSYNADYTILDITEEDIKMLRSRITTGTYDVVLLDKKLEPNEFTVSAIDGDDTMCNIKFPDNWGIGVYTGGTQFFAYTIEKLPTKIPKSYGCAAFIVPKNDTKIKVVTYTLGAVSVEDDYTLSYIKENNKESTIIPFLIVRKGEIVFNKLINTLDLYKNVKDLSTKVNAISSETGFLFSTYSDIESIANKAIVYLRILATKYPIKNSKGIGYSLLKIQNGNPKLGLKRMLSFGFVVNKDTDEFQEINICGDNSTEYSNEVESFYTDAVIGKTNIVHRIEVTVDWSKVPKPISETEYELYKTGNGVLSYYFKGTDDYLTIHELNDTIVNGGTLDYKDYFLNVANNEPFSYELNIARLAFKNIKITTLSGLPAKIEGYGPYRLGIIRNGNPDINVKRAVSFLFKKDGIPYSEDMKCFFILGNTSTEYREDEETLTGTFSSKDSDIVRIEVTVDWSKVPKPANAGDFNRFLDLDESKLTDKAFLQGRTYKGLLENNRSVPKSVIFVDVNGNGDYKTIQEALDNAHDSKENPVTIIVLPGTYITEAYDNATRYKGSNRYLTIRGTQRDACIIRNDNGYYNVSPYYDNGTLKLHGQVLLENLTIINTDDEFEAPDGENAPTDSPENWHKAYCVHFDFSAEEGTTATIRNCKLINNHYACVGCGNKDTLIFENCEMEITNLYGSNGVRGCIYAHDSDIDRDFKVIIKYCQLTSVDVPITIINAYNKPMSILLIGNVVENKKGGAGITYDGTYHSLSKLSFGNNSADMNYSAQ